MSVAALAGAGAAAVCALMLILWLIHFPLRNAAIVDGGWAGGLAILAILYASLGSGYGPRRLLIGVMGAVWGLRLSLYILFTRVFGHPEEGRYVELRRKWATNIPLKFLAFFEFQALLCVLLSIPFLVAARDPQPRSSPLEFAAAILWVLALAGESAADRQLHRFKLDPASKGKTCRAGLWRYSRHPNYFFEWLIWVSYALFALPSPGGLYALSAPALMLYFLFRVTGIPATEAQSLRSKGDDYRRYQKSTSAFIPWFPKAETE
jgi:steroid 5-alpha reductase family enzyme